MCYSWSLKEWCSDSTANSIGAAEVAEQVEVEVANGYTITQFCDKIIDVFMNEKPKLKEWRKYLVFREEWNKYREAFYNRCQTRAYAETDPVIKKKLIELGRKVKKVTMVSFFFFLFKYLCLRYILLHRELGENKIN